MLCLPGSSFLITSLLIAPTPPPFPKRKPVLSQAAIAPNQAAKYSLPGSPTTPSVAMVSKQACEHDRARFCVSCFLFSHKGRSGHSDVFCTCFFVANCRKGSWLLWPLKSRNASRESECFDADGSQA